MIQCTGTIGTGTMVPWYQVPWYDHMAMTILFSTLKLFIELLRVLKRKTKKSISVPANFLKITLRTYIRTVSRLHKFDRGRECLRTHRFLRIWKSSLIWRIAPCRSRTHLRCNGNTEREMRSHTPGTQRERSLRYVMYGSSFRM